MPIKRLAQIVHLRPEAVDANKECHAKVWPEVLQQIHDCNIRDCKFLFISNFCFMLELRKHFTQIPYSWTIRHGRSSRL